MKTKNVLLARDDVGRSKPCTFQLPPQDFVYGKAMTKNEANVGQLTTEWMVGDGQKQKPKLKLDYLKLNKL